MNSSTTKHSPAIALPALRVVLEAACSAPARMLHHASAWLKTRCARRAKIEQPSVLDRASDYRDLERLIRAVNRHMVQPGCGAGGRKS